MLGQLGKGSSFVFKGRRGYFTCECPHRNDDYGLLDHLSGAPGSSEAPDLGLQVFSGKPWVASRVLGSEVPRMDAEGIGVRRPVPPGPRCSAVVILRTALPDDALLLDSLA